jgi:hypothetical protein
MSRSGPRLKGVRVGDDTDANLSATLCVRQSEDLWRARIAPAGIAHVGDRIRFGEDPDCMACYFGVVDADVIERNGDIVLLSFRSSGGALDDSFERFCRAPT